VEGFLTPLEDTEALAVAIMRLLKDPEKRWEMGKAAHARVLQNYTTDHMCKQYLQLMEKLLK
jgi:glycosyltransferase involved in cell wall biosynthesis